MHPEIELMHMAWREQSAVGPSVDSKVSLETLVKSILAVGPHYFYLVDFSDYDRTKTGNIYYVTESVNEIHGEENAKLKTIDDVLTLIHPDDMMHVASAEAQSLDYYYKVLGGEKIIHYKTSYNFRMKTAGGNYELFNHQSLVLSTDQNGRCVTSVNIHTNISHLTDRNHYKFSLIGLNGYPSYLNIEVVPQNFKLLPAPPAEHVLSARELEILRLLKQGYKSQQIADTLNISFHTVKTHRKNMLRKSGALNTTSLIMKFMAEGWI